MGKADLFGDVEKILERKGCAGSVLRRGVAVPRMENVVNAMAENQGGDDVEEEADGGNDKDRLDT